MNLEQFKEWFVANGPWQVRKQDDSIRHKIKKCVVGQLECCPISAMEYAPYNNAMAPFYAAFHKIPRELCVMIITAADNKHNRDPIVQDLRRFMESHLTC